MGCLGSGSTVRSNLKAEDGAMMTHLPTGDGTFWTRDKVLCLNSLRKWRSVDVVACVSWARQDTVETGREQAGAGRGQCQRLVSGQHPVSGPLCSQLGATGEGMVRA